MYKCVSVSSDEWVVQHSGIAYSIYFKFSLDTELSKCSVARVVLGEFHVR